MHLFKIYRFLEYVRNKNNQYINTHDNCCIREQHINKYEIEKMSQQLPALSFETIFITEEQSTKAAFEDAVTESIDTILSLIGNTNKQTIYHCLENRYGIKKEEIPDNIPEFAYAFEEIFGSVAKLIEIKIIERLHAKYKDFSYVPENGEIDFSEFISNFHRYIES
jgi:hypothetical protein